MADANENPKLNIEVKCCKTWTKDGIKLLKKRRLTEEEEDFYEL